MKKVHFSTIDVRILAISLDIKQLLDEAEHNIKNYSD